jgi:hypothetical protein
MAKVRWFGDQKVNRQGISM